MARGLRLARARARPRLLRAVRPALLPRRRPPNWPPPGWADNFKNTLFEDIIPMVDANYRTLADPAHRAMAGLSMGGMQTNAIAMENLDVFSHIGIFSGGTVGDPATAHNGVMANTAEFNKKVKLVFQSAVRVSVLEPEASYEQLSGRDFTVMPPRPTPRTVADWRRSLRNWRCCCSSSWRTQLTPPGHGRRDGRVTGFPQERRSSRHLAGRAAPASATFVCV
jgi:hypothetical protein